MSENTSPAAAQEQAEMDPTKAAALAWVDAAHTYAQEREGHFDKESLRALGGTSMSMSRPGPVPAGFNGTQIDREILQAEGSYDEEYDPTPAQEAASREADHNSQHYGDTARYFGLVQKEIQDDALDAGRLTVLAELEGKRQAELAQDKPDIIAQQVDVFEAANGVDLHAEMRALEDSQWYRDQASTDQ